jgi:hypothetical protein
MPNTESNMSLHLCYRLWIADLNADIIMLRIFDDHIAELASKKNEPAIKNQLNDFQKRFISLRTEIDELRHEMYLIKMKLAANLREEKLDDLNSGVTGSHAVLKKRYTAFRKSFDKIKKEIVAFQSK